ncbi:hypothetical protein GCM10019016_018160 [Streptomyces prasinosporus]|uniref:Uncharacterized protein n=1 Tax=Streptomyces prasinosporus TaxID=68256 RepID=A0ABP6TJS0_9ACTN
MVRPQRVRIFISASLPAGFPATARPFHFTPVPPEMSGGERPPDMSQGPGGGKGAHRGRSGVLGRGGATSGRPAGNLPVPEATCPHRIGRRSPQPPGPRAGPAAAG